MEGTITRMVPERGFGFIAVPHGPDVFMHVKEVGDALEWGEQLTGQRVTFDLEKSDRGPRAVHVRPAP